ncbi:YibE/F family protein [Photobacterium lipolyticum]|uniref:YibE/F family protein n=1 Tax=Photobacterium lipolyticum TaxID=266810 RepID=A0A2T3N2C0_9GAMM|nr:YibE/F family protein [Photobacterium lipolyticum]PSW06522.1 YibE/F family protein [Photobacterium lipolyticum]
MIKKYSFSLIIVILSTLIFYFSPKISEDFRPSNKYRQEFAHAKVLTITKSELTKDSLAPSILTGRQEFSAEILDGPMQGKVVEVKNPLSRQHNVLANEGGEFIMLIRETPNGQLFWAFNHQRSTAIYWMTAVFVGLLLLFGKREGLQSIVSLYFTAALIIGILIPAIFAGFSPIWVTVGLMALKIVVNFILVAGYNRKSASAMLGTLLGVLCAGIMAQWFGEMAHLSGIYLDKGEDVMYLVTDQPIQIRWLMFVAIMISALGAVMDVAISIASAYNELQQANPNQTPRQLMLASMNIGRDIMGTMTNTLILAFTGSSITTIMMVWGLDMPLIQFINTPIMSLSIIHALAGSIGIVLTIPLTALLSSIIFKPSHETQATECFSLSETSKDHPVCN